MQILSAAALVGLLSATADASRCKDRPGHYGGGPAIWSTFASEPTQEAATTSLVQSPTAAPSSSSLASEEAVSPSATPAVSTTTVTSAPSEVPTVQTSSAEATSTAAPSSEASSAAPSVETSTAAPVVTPSSTATPVEPSTSSSAVASSSAPAATESTDSTSLTAGAVPIIDAPAQAQMCTDDQKTTLTEWGLVVQNFRVQESSVEGTVCTTYNGMVTLTDGQAAVNFTADANLVYDEATINDNKYYSNVGLGENMGSQISSVSSFPASYTWSRTNTTNFRGNIAFDLVVAPTSDDRTSSATKELMLWLYWQGDQRPLAWDNGTKASFDLYGQSWDMYQGVNYNLAGGEGVELTTIVPHDEYGAAGSWSGDLKDWLSALVSAGVMTDDYYITNANAGTEQYWGDSVLQSVVSLAINL